ncbi:hypothetical protein [Streptomyces sp. NPDC031705]|uniref:hypothetical protein n=1 Tax=Streptomyces sp. NPDC031705 TaxID=3155729 RepID=UPI003409FB95
MTTPPNPYSGAPVPPNPHPGPPAGQNPYGQSPAGQNPYAPGPAAAHPAAAPPAGQNPYAPNPAAPNPYGPPAGGPGHPAAGHPAPHQGHPTPGYPAPGPGHPQQPQPQHPQYAAPHPHAQVPGCRNCGAPEAANFAVRAHVGVLVLMRFHTLNGPFCRQCGRALVRTMTTKTLCQGWWSPLSLVVFTPFTLLWNLIAAMKFAKLPHPTPAPGHRPLDEGPPVHARPLAYVAIIPLLWATWVVVNIVLDVTGRR